MALIAEILSSCLGAGRIFLFDHRGYQYFNFSREGFWRSFLAAFLVAPLFLAIMAAQHRVVLHGAAPQQLAELPSLARMLVLELLVYPVYWAAFPLLMLWLVRLLGVPARYTPYITVYNWSAVIAVTIEAVPYVLLGLHILPLQLLQPSVFTSVVIALVYRWSIAHTALGIGTFAAVGVVFADLALAIAIAICTQALLLS